MDEAAAAGLDVELISYGHSVIQAANLHVPLAFGRTSFVEQAVPPEPFEHGVRRPLRTGRMVSSTPQKDRGSASSSTTRR
jgi:hypothetical protein